MQPVTKTITLTKLHDSDAAADMEARQFATYDDMLDHMTPSPKTWSVRAVVKSADVFKAKTPRDKARVRLTVEVTGEERRIVGWANEYNTIHGQVAETGQSMRNRLSNEQNKAKDS